MRPRAHRRSTLATAAHLPQRQENPCTCRKVRAENHQGRHNLRNIETIIQTPSNYEKSIFILLRTSHSCRNDRMQERKIDS